MKIIPLTNIKSAVKTALGTEPLAKLGLKPLVGS